MAVQSVHTAIFRNWQAPIGLGYGVDSACKPVNRDTGQTIVAVAWLICGLIGHGSNAIVGPISVPLNAIRRTWERVLGCHAIYPVGSKTTDDSLLRRGCCSLDSI